MMITKKISLFLLLGLLVACQSDGFLFGTGKIIREYREIGDFSKVRIKSVVDVIITQDTINRVVVEAGEKMLPRIKTQVKYDELIIEDQNKIRWLNPYDRPVIHLSVKELIQITPDEACYVSSTNALTGKEIGINYLCDYAECNLILDCGIVYFWNVSANIGYLNLSGQVDIGRFWNYGVCHIDARNLKSKEVLIENHSLGDSYVSPDSILRVGIYNDGNVFYNHQPLQIDTIEVFTGNGQLIYTGQ